jgi:hypothetical protein
MRIVVLLCLSAALLLSGCFSRKSKGQVASFGAPSSPATTPQKLIVTADDSLVGKVAMVNQTGRFVVLNFPLGRLPPVDQRFALYRGGVKVGEVKITGPQHDDNVVADLVTGDSEPGDEARKE